MKTQRKPRYMEVSVRTGLNPTEGNARQLSRENPYEDFYRAIALLFPQAKKIRVGTFRQGQSIIATFSLPRKAAMAWNVIQNGFIPEFRFGRPEQIDRIVFPPRYEQPEKFKISGKSNDAWRFAGGAH